MLDQGFTTAEMAAVFTPAARVAAMFEFEAALALALADTGLVDTATAEIVAEACREPVEDPEAVLATTWSEGTPLPALLDNIRSRLSDDEARWVHYGTTTQDAVDTGTVLLARRGLEILDSGLLAAAGEMARLVAAHRDQPQMGRTFPSTPDPPPSASPQPVGSMRHWDISPICDNSVPSWWCS
jgi:3-carboxy-cis,cis-muconate cycloisomerase